MSIKLKVYFVFSGTSNIWNEFRNCFAGHQDLESKCNYYTRKSENTRVYRVSFDGIAADLFKRNKEFIKSNPSNIKFDPTKKNYGLDNYDQKLGYKVPALWRFIRGSGMKHLCEFTLDMLKSILNEVITENPGHNINLKIYGIGYSRGAFTILKMISNPIYKRKMHSIIISFSKQIKTFGIFCFLGDPVPGRAQDEKLFYISRYVKKLNIYFSNHEVRPVLRPFRYDWIKLESQETKYCIHPYDETHTGILQALGNNVRFYFKSDMGNNKFKNIKYHNILGQKKISTFVKRDFTKFLENKGERLFQNLYEQFSFKEQYPNLYKYMGFEKIFVQNSLNLFLNTKKIVYEELKKLDVNLCQLQILLQTRFTNTFNKSDWFNKLENLAFMERLDLLYVPGEHNIKSHLEFIYLTEEVKTFPILNSNNLSELERRLFIDKFFESFIRFSNNCKNFRNELKYIPVYEYNSNSIISNLKIVHNFISSRLLINSATIKNPSMSSFYTFYKNYIINNKLLL